MLYSPSGTLYEGISYMSWRCYGSEQLQSITCLFGELELLVSLAEKAASSTYLLHLPVEEV